MASSSFLTNTETTQISKEQSGVFEIGTQQKTATIKKQDLYKTIAIFVQIKFSQEPYIQ